MRKSEQKMRKVNKMRKYDTKKLKKCGKKISKLTVGVFLFE